MNKLWRILWILWDGFARYVFVEDFKRERRTLNKLLELSSVDCERENRNS